MTKIQIRRLSDQKVFDEDTLAELIEGENTLILKEAHTCSLNYEGKRWIVNYYLGTCHNWFHLNPQKYSIEFSDAIPVEVVKKMVEEIKTEIAYNSDGQNDTSSEMQIIDSIATKYIKHET